MRRLILLFVLLALCVPNTDARRPRKKAGKVKNHVYTDAKYGFQITLHEGWSYKVRKLDENYRLVLTQKNYEIPTDFLDAEHYTKVPRLVVWAGEAQLGAAAFVDSLLSDSYDSDIKDDVIKETDILNPMSAPSGAQLERLVPRARRTIELDGSSGVYWAGRVNYMMEVALSASTQGGKRVRGGYGGAIVTVKKDKTLVVFSTISEWTSFQNVSAQVMEMINSFNWVDDDENEKEEEEEEEG